MTNKTAEAQAAARRFDTELEAARADLTLSATGKRQKVARLYRDHARRMERLKAEHLAERDARRRSLEQRAFGPRVPTSASDSEKLLAGLSCRDAVLRAVRLESHTEAEGMMGIAMRIGDNGLARRQAPTQERSA